ncbi:MAG: hypothetical protein ACRD2I_07250, partial [Vicinamibacterales bacterium]
MARAIADGSEVDWERVSSEQLEPEQRRLLEPLRVIAGIAAVRRGEDAPLEAPPMNAERSRTAAANLPAGLSDRWGDLILIEEIGQGSFGTVYRAH